jgi:endonuclease YncB( thermonuclease family)
MVMRLLTALVLALALALAVASSAQAQTVSGSARVLDGDTIEVGGVRVRLEGLHCPESGERGGSAATSAMRGLTRWQHVT